MDKKWSQLFNISFKNKILMIFILFFSISMFLYFNRNTINISVEKIGIKFQIHILNLEFPLGNEINEQNGIYLSDNVSIKQGVMNFLGINKNSIENTLNKEMWQGYNADKGLVTIPVSPFKLTASDISKEEIAVKESNKSDISTENNNSKSQDINNNSNIDVNVYNSALKLKTIGQTPRVLIYHSHTCESYAPGPIDTFDESVNICSVGDELEKELEGGYNIYTLNDKTIHDAYGYIDSYKRSGVTLSKYLKKYGDFDLIIDMHRDSIDDKKVVTTKINSENIANIRFVMAKQNPHFSKNIKLVNSLISISKNLFPGFCRDTYYYNVGMDFFNQAKSNNAVLVEVGSNVNTTTEAKASAKYLARIIAEYIAKK
jgi:stage II sporulation protein P